MRSDLKQGLSTLELVVTYGNGHSRHLLDAVHTAGA